MLSVVLVHQADRAAENGSYSGVEMWHFIALICQGLRIAIPAGLLLVISPDAIQKALAAIPPVYLWRSACRWWDGCCRWLCNGYQPYGYS